MHWDDPEGWYGEGGASRGQDREHVYTCGRNSLFDSLSVYDAFKESLKLCFQFPYLAYLHNKPSDT